MSWESPLSYIFFFPSTLLSSISLLFSLSHNIIILPFLLYCYFTHVQERVKKYFFPYCKPTSLKMFEYIFFITWRRWIHWIFHQRQILRVHIIYIFNLFCECLFVCVCLYVCDSILRFEDNFRKLILSYHVSLQRIEFRSSRLASRTFTCWTTSLTSIF